MLRLILGSCTILLLCFGLISTSPQHGYDPYYNPRQLNNARHAKGLEMLSYLNTSTDVCEDFNEFACGNYGQYFQEFLEFGQWSPMYHAKHLMDQKIKKYLNETDRYDRNEDRHVKNFYKSCLNKPTTPSAYNYEMKKFIHEFGKMPVMEGHNWHENDFDWSQLVAQITAKTGLGIIMQAKLTPDSYQNTISRASLLQPKFMFPKKIYYEDHKFLDVRVRMTKMIATNLQNFLNINENLARQTAEEIFSFETQLAHGMQDLNTDAPNILYNWTGIDELQSQYKHAWDTVQHFATALDLYPTKVMAQSTYLNNLAQVIHRTPQKQIANYIYYIYMFEYIQQLVSPCESVVRTNFNEYIENTMYHKHASEQDKDYIDYIWQELKIAFEDTLQRVNWIGDDTREAAIEKLHAMKLTIDTYNHIDFPQKYATLSLSEYDFLNNYHAILMLRGKEFRASVTQPPKFQDAPADNLVYAPEENVVHFPVAYVVPTTIWSTEYPHAINFGSIGTFMGHEMGHGFDDLARHFDKHGNYHNWWDSKSSRNFEDRKACISNQYRNYEFKGVNLPELESQCENIADNIGAKHAFKAYMKWYSSASASSRQNEYLPSLQYDNEQLFFLSFAQAMGGALSKNFIYDNDFHLPGELRVRGTIDNMIEFAEVFDCPRGSVMNPVRKCELY